MIGKCRERWTLFGIAGGAVVTVAVAAAGCSSGGGSAATGTAPGKKAGAVSSPTAGSSPTPNGLASSGASPSGVASSAPSPSPSTSTSSHVPVAPGSTGTGPATKLPAYIDSAPVGDALTWRPVSPGVELAGDSSAFAARFDPSAVRFVLHAGTQVPGGSGWAGGDTASTSGLVAGWNGGFLMANNASWGGFYLGGQTSYGPLRTGTASEVFYKDGSMDVLVWPGGLPSTDVTGVRQNLAPLIDGGRLAADLNDGTAADERTWGFTNNSADEHGNRSGAGVTADGKVVYAAVRGASPLQLAQYLQRAGAVRAMELDINFSRPIFGTFSQGHWTEPAPWLGPAGRFTAGDERDFVVVYGR